MDTEKKATATWTCHACTFLHVGQERQLFLACEVCQTPRATGASSKEETTNPPERQQDGDAKVQDDLKLKAGSKVHNISKSSNRSPLKSNLSLSSPWGSLRPPTEKDVVGTRKRRRGLDAPPPLLDYIMVMDFEWTADNQRRMEPVAEITQFPSVLMKLFETRNAAEAYYNSNCPTENATTEAAPSFTNVELPEDLIRPFTTKIRHDALAVAGFDTFVRPTLNPRLTPFSIELTAITQADVDQAPTIDKVIEKYTEWLQRWNLIDKKGQRIGNWCFATWGDGDIMSTLLQELNYKKLNVPPYFDRWINLKADSIYKKHYHREPRGGLRRCVESVGAVWNGRAHNGFVDSVHTAKMVRHMTQTGFRFSRSTRGLDRQGRPFGQKPQGRQPLRKRQR